LERALRKYEESLRIFERVDSYKGGAGSMNGMARVYSHFGKHEKSLAFLLKAEDLLRKLHDRQSYEMLAITFNNMALVYSKLGQPKRAFSCCQEALARSGIDGGGFSFLRREDDAVLQIQRIFGDVYGKAAILNNMALICQSVGENDRALAYCEDSLKFQQKDRDARVQAATLHVMGLIHFNLGHYKKALGLYEKASILRKNQGASGEAETLNSIAEVHRYLGEYNKALRSLKKALVITNRLGDVTAIGGILDNLASVYSDQGQYQRALQFYDQALALRERYRATAGEGETLKNIARIFAQLGRYHKALELSRKALMLQEKVLDYGGQGMTLINMAEASEHWGRYQKALELYEKALEITKRTGDIQKRGATLNHIGRVYQSMGQYQMALTRFRAGLKIFGDIGISTRWPKDLIGNLYLDMGDIDSGRPFIMEAGYASSLGRLYLTQLEYEQAKDFFGKLLGSADKNRDVKDLLVAYTGLGTAYEGMGNDPKAAEYFQKAVEFVEELRSSSPRDQREKFFDLRVNGFYRTAPYEGLARVLTKLNRHIEALKASEQTKARVFAERMSRFPEAEGTDVPAKILRKDSELTDMLSALKQNRQKAYEKGNKELIASLAPQIQELEDKFQAHVKMLRNKYPLFAATKYPEPMDLAQTAVKEDEWILSYDVTDSGVIVYLTKGKQLVKALFKPVKRKDLDELVRTFREPLEVKTGKLLKKKLTTFDFTSGKKLFDLLLSDVLPDLPAGTPVIVVPDDSLGVIPFEMLVLNDGGKIETDKKIPYVTGAQFFGDRNPVSYYQSITALTLARTLGKQKKPGTRLLVMADPVFKMGDKRSQKSRRLTRVAGVEDRLYQELMAAVQDGKFGGLSFGRLPLTGKLADDLGKLFPGGSDTFQGVDASKQVFLKKIAPRLNLYADIVFATHGYFGKDLPGIMEPVLVLTLVPPGTDGYLRLSEVMGLDTNANVVALTACRTGMGRRISGEGVMGMGRAFQYAGAKSVLMSLWNVEQKASVTLVEGFFKRLKAGKTKLQALKLARAQIRQEGYDHPFFWAPFILVGEVD